MSTKGNGNSSVPTDFTQGLNGLASGSNTMGFTMGDASTAGGPQPMAGMGTSGGGLGGVGAGMSGDFTQGLDPGLVSGTQQYQFTTDPMSSGPNTQTLGQSLGMGAAMAGSGDQTQTRTAGNGGRVSVRAQNFGTGVSDQLAATGSGAGGGLLQLLQKYQVGR